MASGKLAMRRGSSGAAIATRLLDQGFWSAGAFALTLGAALALSVEDFSTVALGITISILAIAATRNWCIYARVIAGAKHGVIPAAAVSRRTAFRTTLAAALPLGLGLWALLSATGNSLAGSTALLTATLIMNDTPRQLLVISGRYKTALITAALNATAGCVGLIVAVGTAEGDFLPVWIGLNCLTIVIGWWLAKGGTPPRQVAEARSHSWRMSLEALYLGLSGQVAIILLYGVGDSSATAGFRLASTIIFAPAFAIVQGLQPLLFRRVASASSRSSREVRQAILIWQAAMVLLYLVVGGGAALVGSFGKNIDVLEAAIPYALPVGVFALSSLVLDASLLGLRITWSPSAMLRTRLVLVTIDLVAQTAALLAFGLDGLITSLLILGPLKIAIATLLTRLARTAPSEELKTGLAV